MRVEGRRWGVERVKDFWSRMERRVETGENGTEENNVT